MSGTPPRQAAKQASHGASLDPMQQLLLDRLERRTDSSANIDALIDALTHEGYTDGQIREKLRERFGTDPAVKIPSVAGIRQRRYRLRNRKPTLKEFVEQVTPEMYEIIGETESMASLIARRAAISIQLGDAGLDLFFAEPFRQPVGKKPHPSLEPADIDRLRDECRNLITRIGRAAIMQHSIVEMYKFYYLAEQDEPEEDVPF